MTRYVVPLIVVLILGVFFYFGLQRDPSVLPSQYIGKPAPVFDLPTLRDPAKRFSNANITGQVSLVNIWATWCVGCRHEHAFLVELAEEGDYPIYGINWRDGRGAAIGWLEQLGDPYVASGYDEDGRVGIDWGVYGAPETFLITPSGEVAYRFTGPLSRSAWEAEFLPLIAEIENQ